MMTPERQEEYNRQEEHENRFEEKASHQNSCGFQFAITARDDKTKDEQEQMFERPKKQ